VLRIRGVYPGSRIPDPDVCPSRIPDPKTAIKQKGEKNFVLPFLVATNITKLKTILLLSRRRKFSKKLWNFLPTKCH
jgi:hypothetical protein